MKITDEMLEEAIEKINKNHTVTLVEMPFITRSELADVLTGMINPDQRQYDFHINQIPYGVETLDELIATLNKRAEPGDNIYVEVHESDDFDLIGSAEWQYQTEGTFVHHITSYGAGIDLHEAVNELAKQPVQA